MGTTDWDEEGLLDGLEGEERDARRALLDHLQASGFSLRQLRDAHARGEVVFLPIDRVIGGVDRLTGAEVADTAGVDQEFLAAARRASGLFLPGDPDDPALVEADLRAARAVAALEAQGVSREQILEFSRMFSHALAPIAQTLRDMVLENNLRPGVSEIDLVDGVAAQAEGLTPILAPLLGDLLLLNIRAAVRSEVVTTTDRETGAPPGAREVAVGFADLVGFTRLGEAVPPGELGRVADRLKELTAEALEPPVRVAKTLGDGVMLVSPDVSAMLSTVLAIVAAADAEGEAFPQVHAGISFGPVSRRGGDWYGAPVNLASRISDAARAGSVLASAGVFDRAPEAVAWSRAGTRSFKGVREPVRLYRARLTELR